MPHGRFFAAEENDQDTDWLLHKIPDAHGIEKITHPIDRIKNLANIIHTTNK